MGVKALDPLDPAKTTTSDEIAAELSARAGSGLTDPDARVIRQTAAATTHLVDLRAVLVTNPENAAALAAHARLTANLLAGVPKIMAIVGEIQGTAFDDILGGVRAE